MTVKNLTALLLAVVFLVACGRSETDVATSAAPEPAAEAASEPAAMPEPEPASDLRTLLADETRPDEDRARDAGRKPADVLEFLGVGPGMAVLDIMASGGYYTEVLSIAVGPDGRVVAHNTPAFLQFRDGYYDQALNERLAGDRLPNVSRLNMDFKELSADDGPFDAAITALNFHDLVNMYGNEEAVAALQAIGTTLKPGGVLGVIDHVGVEDADNAQLHRIEASVVSEIATAAGFVAAGQSDILANADDDHSQGVFSEEVRGKTDRFLLRFEIPAE